MSLAQMAKITTLFQRFKSQKVGGKYYPWFKPYKLPYDCCDGPDTKPHIVYRCKPVNSNEITLRQHIPDEVSPKLERRRSSDFYELPTSSYIEQRLQESTVSLGRETSVVDGPRRLLLKDDITVVDSFSPKRLVQIKGLPEDDIVGKFVSFLWWFCFLLPRMLAISSFAYFYPTEIIWLLSFHFIFTIAFLLYDVRHDEVRRAKAIFFIFIGFVYMFCLIEFKIKFKKTKFIYNGFFFLMFCENFIMVFIWWFRDIEEILNDWWFKYIFYLIIGCSVLSIMSMLMYIKILKPKKVVLDEVPQK